MSDEPDYQAAYEVLRQAVDDAARILNKACLQTTLKIAKNLGELTPENT